MTKVLQTTTDLQKHLDEQLQLLELLGDAYDKGKAVAAKQIATVVRVLLHDTPSSTSLLTQLGLKTGLFFDSCTSLGQKEGKRLGGFTGIVGMGVGPDPAYIPYLDSTMDGCYGVVPFEDYWDRVVLVDGKGESFSRKYLILKVANQDGGAHIDPEIDERYANLARKNSMGWKSEGLDGVQRDISGVELATVRQIGHELLRSLRPDTPKMDMKTKGAAMVVGGIGAWIGSVSRPLVKPTTRPNGPKIGRNEHCPCGSGKKYKKCHG